MQKSQQKIITNYTPYFKVTLPKIPSVIIPLHYVSVY